MIGSSSQTVQFVYAVFKTETELANKHRDTIKAALSAHKKAKKWKVGPDLFVGNDLNLSEAMQGVSGEIDNSHHYIFLSDGEPLNAHMQRMLRNWPKNSSRGIVVFINDEALAGNGGNPTRRRLYEMAREGHALGTVAARDANHNELQRSDLEMIITHLLK